jgi:hypothetical protein
MGADWPQVEKGLTTLAFGSVTSNHVSFCMEAVYLPACMGGDIVLAIPNQLLGTGEREDLLPQPNISLTLLGQSTSRRWYRDGASHLSGPRSR